ncbi:oligosaccharide flippase family protein [Flavobacteriaceae bacterium]|nr:oligosaccharide flippase family protein [Flavobacteriaceae bacterium]
MLNLKQQLNSFLLYLLPFLMRSVLPILTLPVFTRFLTPNDYGVLALVSIYVTLIVGLSNLGMIVIFERNYFEEKTIIERIQLMWSLISIVSLLLLASTIFSVRFEDTIIEFLFNRNLPSRLLLFTFLHLGVKSLLQYFYMFYRNSETPKKFTTLAIIESILSTSISLILVVFYEQGIVGFIKGQSIGVCSVFAYLLIGAFFKREFSINFFKIKSTIKLSAPLTPRIFFGVINSQFDRYMLGGLNTVNGVGIYDIGQKIANLGFVFMTTLQQIFAPRLYAIYFEDKENFRIESGNLLAPFYFLSTFFCFLLGLFSEEAIYLLTTPEYYDSTPIILILTMLYASYFFGKQPQLLLVKKTGLISFLSIFTVGLNVLLNIPLIYFYGIYGAAWGTFISGIISSGIAFFFAQKHLPIHYAKETITFHLILLGGILILIILWFIKTPYSIRLISKILILISFLSTGHYYGYLTHQNFKSIINSIKR